MAMQGAMMGGEKEMMGQQEGGGEAPEGGGKPGGSIADVIQGVNSGLLVLAKVLDGAKDIPPPVKEKLGGIIQQYQEFISKDLVGGGEEAPAPRGSQPVPMEVGAAKAKPVM